MDINQATAKADERSKEYGSTVHVGAFIRLKTTHVEGVRRAHIEYFVSDWFDSASTVYTSTNGVGEYTS
jgi:hypothetical protein